VSIRDKRLVASNKDPALVIWHAINVLAEVQTDLPLSRRILEAEMLLLNLMLEIWESAEGRELGVSQVDRATIH
jgi:hypothetical protein